MTEAAQQIIDDQVPADAPSNDPAPANPAADKPADAPAGNALDEGAKPDKEPVLPDNWRELASSGNEDQLKLLKRYGSLNGVVKALVEAQTTIRSGKLKRDMPDASDEKAMAEWRKDNGIPADPTGYQLPEAITKRLVDADKPVLSSFTEFAHSKNAPPAFVDMATEWYVNMQEQAAAAQTDSDNKAREAAEDAMRGNWSRDEYKGNMQLAQRFMSSAGIGNWADARLPDGRRLGDMPELIQWASDQGRNAFGDVAFASSDAQAKHENRKAELEKLRDTDFDKYVSTGGDKEMLKIIETDLKRAKR